MIKKLKSFTSNREDFKIYGGKLLENFNISDIEKMKESDALALCLFVKNIKDHNVYFVDFGGYFGFCALVFKNNHHIHYANEYGLHNTTTYNRETKQSEPLNNVKRYKRYIERLNNKLFTEDELIDRENIKTYQDTEKRRRYLHNYYNMQYDYISIFKYCKNEEERNAYEKSIKNMIYNPVGFCYMKKEDAPAIEKQKELLNKLYEIEQELKNTYDYLLEAFKYEMFNHEYAINSYQGNWDTLSAIYGDIEYDQNDDRRAYYKQLNFNDIQIKAYEDARAYVIKNTEY